MFKVKNGSIPDTFQNKFHLISHDYFTKNSMYNFKEPRFSLKITKFAISSCGPRLWNKILDNDTKAFTFPPLFPFELEISILVLIPVGRIAHWGFLQTEINLRLLLAVFV